MSKQENSGKNRTMSDQENPITNTEDTGENREEVMAPVAEAAPVEEATTPEAETSPDADEAQAAAEETPAMQAPVPTQTATSPAEREPADAAQSATDDDSASQASSRGPGEYIPPERESRSRRVGSDIRLEDVSYRNVALLARFIDGRGRILSRRKTRVSAKMQRRVVRAIKQARHLALLPYTGDHSRIVRKRR